MSISELMRTVRANRHFGGEEKCPVSVAETGDIAVSLQAQARKFGRIEGEVRGVAPAHARPIRIERIRGDLAAVTVSGGAVLVAGSDRPALREAPQGLSVSAEILEQLVRLRNLLPAGERLTHIVVMGMGEPLANLDSLLEALAVAGAKDGLDIGARHITISTVGLPVKIRRLADLGKQYHLAVSLHAPNDTLRTEIVPTNAKTGIPEILEQKFQALRERFAASPYYLRVVYTSEGEGAIAEHLNATMRSFPELLLGSYPKIGDPEYAVRLTLESKDREYLERALAHLLSLLPPEAVVRAE